MSVSALWIGKQPINDFIKNVYLPLQKKVGGEIRSPRAKAMAVGKKALNNLSRLAGRVVAGSAAEIETFSSALDLVELAFQNIIGRKKTNSHSSIISDADVKKLREFVTMVRKNFKELIDLTLSPSNINLVSTHLVARQVNEKEQYANQAAYDAVYEMEATKDRSSMLTAEINSTLERLSAKVQYLTAQLADFVSTNEKQNKLHEVALKGLAEQQATSMILIKRLDSLEAGFQRIESALADKQESHSSLSIVDLTTRDNEVKTTSEAASLLQKSTRMQQMQAIAPNDPNLALLVRSDSSIWSILGWGLVTAACGSSAGVGILGAAGSASALTILLSPSAWAMLASVAVSASILSFYQLTKVFIQYCVPGTDKLQNEVSFSNELNDEDDLLSNESTQHHYNANNNAINNKLGSRLSSKASARLAKKNVRHAVNSNKPVASVKKSPLGQYSITPTVDAQQLTERLAEQAKIQSQADVNSCGKLISYELS